MSTLSPQSRSHRRRGLLVGNINVGDTASPSLSTMKVSPQQREQHLRRMLFLSTNKSSDAALLSKMRFAFKELTYRHTWINPLLIILVLVAAFVVSSPDGRLHPTLRAMIVPLYHIAGTDQYGKGVNDFYFVAFYSLFFTFLREFLMSVVLRPCASFFGVRRTSKAKRFMEQTYSMFYYGILGPFGLWVMLRTPLWFFNTRAFYETYPHYTHDWYFKIYYLGQAAFWVQQLVVLVLQLEKPRKDFYELILHHVITIALIWCSYRFHFTWMGIAVYVTMDVSDFFLATLKTLNYIELPLTGPFFVVFVFVWVYLRHWLNLRILWSVLTEFRSVGEWELNWDTQQYKCWISQPIVFFLIAALQILNGYWLFLIFRILLRIAKGGEPSDDRSDDEDEDEEEEKCDKGKKNE